MMKESNLIIRKALPFESKDIEKIHRKAFRAESIYRSIFSSSAISKYLYNLMLEDLYNKDFEKNFFLIAEFSKTLVGYLQVRIISESLHINYIAIDPAFQGKGVAGYLFSYIEGYAYKLKLKKLTLDVDKSNSIAVRWYQKLGFDTAYFNYIYNVPVGNFQLKKCSFKISNWLESEAWQYTFGFSKIILSINNFDNIIVGRLNNNYWRIDNAEYLKNDGFIYALHKIDKYRNGLLINSKETILLEDFLPEEVVLRMEKTLQYS